jgi:hypothetical protein
LAKLGDQGGTWDSAAHGTSGRGRWDSKKSKNMKSLTAQPQKSKNMEVADRTTARNSSTTVNRPEQQKEIQKHQRAA